MILNPQKHALRGFLLIALLLAACTPSRVEQHPPEPVTLKVLLLPYLSFAPLFIAEEEGYFAEQGLQIEFVKISDSAEAIPALAQGELDVWASFVSIGIFNAIAREGGIRLVADKGYIAPSGCTSTALIASKTLVEAGELDSPAQLRGRRIAIEPPTPEGYYVEKLLATAGLTLADVETLDMPPPAELEALENGTIDLSGTSEPWVTRILRTGHGVLWLPVQEVIPDFQWAFIAYGPTLLDENSDAGQRFMVAYLRALRQYGEGKTERNLELLAEFTELEQELLAEVCWPPVHSDGQINVQSVLDFQAWAVDKGYLDRVVTKDEFWDPSFVEYANEVLGAPSE
jgi:NitT/TauT family transport system substrate-binding protein